MAYQPLEIILCQILFKNIHIKYKISKHITTDYILKQAWAHLFCTRLNGLTFFYLIWIILFTINYLFAHS